MAPEMHTREGPIEYRGIRVEVIVESASTFAIEAGDWRVLSGIIIEHNGIMRWLREKKVWDPK